jgi:hypothetical protein
MKVFFSKTEEKKSSSGKIYKVVYLPLYMEKKNPLFVRLTVPRIQFRIRISVFFAASFLAVLL